MAVLSPEFQDNVKKQEIVWHTNKLKNAVTYDSEIIADNFFSPSYHFLHSNISIFELSENISHLRDIRNSQNRTFAKYFMSLMNQLENSGETFKDMIPLIQFKSSQIINDLISFRPDVFKSELTYDNSIFFTFIKDDKKFFLEYYLDYDEGNLDDAEMSLAIPQTNNNFKTITGSYQFVIRNLSKQLSC